MKNFAIILFILTSFNALSQGKADNWYFGYGGGIHFDQNANTVTSINDGQLFTNEGCATISDDTGNLLFYTDGKTVWNKNHNIMPNGNGLYGNSSSTQSAIIVPKPNNPNIYYIFTVDDWGDETNNGLNYSEVDMTLNGGLGSITKKNINLLHHSAEKITAVLKDCFSKSIWVLSFSSQDGNSGSGTNTRKFNTFHAFLVSDLGVSTTSVKSIFNLDIEDVRGYLKLSPDGTKVALANVNDGLYIFDFNATTGIVSNQQLLEIQGSSRYPYGVEFSPNSLLLYVNASNSVINSNQYPVPAYQNSILIQYNLLASNIQSSAVILDNRNLYRGALQLAPNGKIYRALSETYDTGLPYLGVINNPNNFGLNSNYQHNAVFIGPNLSAQGFPTFIASLFNKIDIIKNGGNSVTLSLCEGDTYTLSAENLPGATYSWAKDGNPIPETGYEIEVSKVGYYQVFINPNNGDCSMEGQAYVIFHKYPEAFDATLVQCGENEFTTFNLNQANDALTGGEENSVIKFYSDAARTNEIDGSSFKNITNPQTIFVEVINGESGCASDAELTLNVIINNPNPKQLNVCDTDGTEDGFYYFNLNEANNYFLNGLLGLDVAYYKTYDDALLEENSLGVSFTNTTPYSQIIYARVENNNNCYGISQLNLNVSKSSNIITNEVVFYCTETYPNTITINAGIINDDPINYSYSWNTGEDTYEIQVNEPGTYTVYITSLSCTTERTVIVEPSNIASFQSIDVIDSAQNNIINVYVSGEGTYEYALYDKNNNLLRNYQESNIFENVSPGIYTVYVKDIKNNCGLTNSSVSVFGFPKFFTPNNDGVNDTWQVYGANTMFKPNSKIVIFDRFGKLLKEISPFEIGWDGILNGEKLPSDDYWFSAILQDGRIFKSHFTLKY